MVSRTKGVGLRRLSTLSGGEGGALVDGGPTDGRVVVDDWGGLGTPDTATGSDDGGPVGLGDGVVLGVVTWQVVTGGVLLLLADVLGRLGRVGVAGPKDRLGLHRPTRGERAEGGV